MTVKTLPDDPTSWPALPSIGRPIGEAGILILNAQGEVLTAGAIPAADVLRLAASVDQISPHVLAGSVVRAARQRGLVLELPIDAEEITGHGVRGISVGLFA